MSLGRLAAPAAALALLVAAGAGPQAGALTRPAAGTIVTVAGTGVDGHTGDGGQAASAEIDHPRALAVLPDGGFLFSEPFLNSVRHVHADGTIETVAGTTDAGFSGDGGPATQAELNLVHGVSLERDGSYLLGDARNHRIRRVGTDGMIVTVAGSGLKGFGGDGGPALEARIDDPRGLAALPDGGLLIPDSDNQRVRRVRPDGTIETVAGNGIAGYSGDGGPAASAELNEAFAVAALPDGGFLIADTNNNRIRRVFPDGTISTVAGSGVKGFAGDGGQATEAELAVPHGVAPAPDGGFLIADTGNHRIRRVLPGGTITTVAGNGLAGYSGDGGDARAAALNSPKAVAPFADGRALLVADSANNRVRLVAIDLRSPFELRLAARRLKARFHHAARLVYSLSLPATMRLDVLRGSSRVERRLAEAGKGRNTLVFGARLKRGRYRLIVLASSGDGRSARATATLVVS